MGYYVRVLTPEPKPFPTALLENAVRPFGANVAGDLGIADWNEVVVTSSANDLVCTIERNEVMPGSLGEEEIAEFRELIGDGPPTSGADWLHRYLDSVRTIYAFEVASGNFADEFEVLDAAREAIRTSVGGILQADLEGFTNEEGFYVFWEFANGTGGEIWMAVLKDGEWQMFKMDVSNREHRAAFEAGEVPEGVERHQPASR